MNMHELSFEGHYKYNTQRSKHCNNVIQTPSHTYKERASEASSLLVILYIKSGKKMFKVFHMLLLYIYSPLLMPVV